MTDRKKIRAQVHVRFLPTCEGGRKGPVFSGYSPVLWFGKDSVDPSRLLFDAKSILPGEETDCVLEFLEPRTYSVSYAPGEHFALGEGIRRVARGTILSILNETCVPY